jgi:hypothetical protein
MRKILLILLLPFFVPLIGYGQDCCDFKLIREDTTLRKGIYVIEPEPGFQANVTFEPIPPIIYETADVQTGTWTHGTSTSDPYLNNTVSFSNTIGSTLVFNVYGRRFEIITATASHHGNVGVTLNNGQEISVPLYSATRKNNVIVYSADMPPGTNSIKLRVAGGGYTVLDYIKVYQ